METKGRLWTYISACWWRMTSFSIWNPYGVLYNLFKAKDFLEKFLCCIKYKIRNSVNSSLLSICCISGVTSDLTVCRSFEDVYVIPVDLFLFNIIPKILQISKRPYLILYKSWICTNGHCRILFAKLHLVKLDNYGDKFDCVTQFLQEIQTSMVAQYFKTSVSIFVSYKSVFKIFKNFSLFSACDKDLRKPSIKSRPSNFSNIRSNAFLLCHISAAYLIHVYF